MSAAALHEPWEELERERRAASFGMWVFLASELLFFGSLFTAYAVYRLLYPDIVAAAAQVPTPGSGLRRSMASR